MVSVAIPISAKIDFQDKKGKKRQKSTFYNDKGDNISRTHKIY